MNFSNSEPKVIEGYLQKRKRRMTNGQTTNWRYFKFSLTDKERCLVIKVKKEDNTSLKTYSAKQIKGFTDKLSNEENIFGKNMSFSFKIITSIKQYILAATNKDEFQNWIKILQKFTEAISSPVNFSNFASKYKIPTNMGSNMLQIEAQGISTIPSSNNSSQNLQNNSSKFGSANKFEEGSLNYSKKKIENSKHKKKSKNFLDDSDSDSDEKKDKLDFGPIVVKNHYGNIGHDENFRSIRSNGDFGTFGSHNNPGLISNTNNLNFNDLGFMKIEEKQKIYDNRLKKLNEIPSESNEKPVKNFISLRKPDIQTGRDPVEKVQIQMEGINFRNTNNSINSSFVNNSIRNEDRINRPKDVGVIHINNSSNPLNNSKNQNLNMKINININQTPLNNNNIKNQPKYGKLEIDGEMKKLNINSNIIFEGIPTKEEKGLIPKMKHMEDVKPLALSPNNLNKVNSRNEQAQSPDPHGPILIKESGAHKKKVPRNFLVEFTKQDCFDIGPNNSVKEEEKSDEFDTRKPYKHLSDGNVLDNHNNNERKGKISGGENMVNISRQSEKIIFISEEGFKSGFNIPNGKSNFKSLNNKPIVEESNYLPERPNLAHKNQIQGIVPIEKLQTDFPNIKTKAESKNQNLTQKIQKVDNKPVPVPVQFFDENQMHIKQGILSSRNNMITLENINFCPTENFTQANPVEEKEKRQQSTKKILPRREIGVKEEFKFDIPAQTNANLLQIQELNDRPKEKNFIGRHNMKRKILGSGEDNQIVGGNKKEKEKSPQNPKNRTNEIVNKNKLEVPNIDYIQQNKQMIKMPLDKLALKKDLNHMNVQNTYQLNAHSVLADEFHMPMDKVVNFQHKVEQVMDYNDHSKSNVYLSNIHGDVSTIVGGFGDLESDKIILDEINKVDRHNPYRSYSLLDVEEEWDSKKSKDNDDIKFDL